MIACYGVAMVYLAVDNTIDNTLYNIVLEKDTSYWLDFKYKNNYDGISKTTLLGLFILLYVPVSDP